MRTRARVHTHCIRLTPVLPAKSPLGWIVLFLVLICPGLFCSAQQVHPTEFQVKAAYLYNFGKFIRWQPGAAPATGPFEICVIGKNPFGSTLEATVAGESIDGKNLVAKEISSIQDAGHCRVLFISASEEGRLKPILETARRAGILTVSDVPGFAEHGGMIEFVSQEGRIRFAVNLTPANEAGLGISSELLKVAVKVTGSSQVREGEKR